MLLADSFVLIIGGLFLIGLVGFFVAALVMIVRFVGFVFRKVTGIGGHRPTTARLNERDDVCPHPRCGHVNRAGARYCARCGRPLGQHNDIDAYG